MVQLRRSIAMSLTLIALMVGVIALPAESQQSQERITITLFDPDKTTWEKVIDQGRANMSPGDTILYVDAQLDPDTCERSGTVVGRLAISKLLKQNVAWFIGDFTIDLADGKVVAEAAAKFTEFDQKESGVFAVTGGTGAYRDASGEVLFQEGVTMCGQEGSLTTIDVGPQP